jgi:retron-type reverse transcriptase
MTDDTHLTLRINESNILLSKYSDKIPIIITSKDKKLFKNLKKNKFLVPYDMTISYLLVAVRKQFKIENHEAIFMCCNNKLLSGSISIIEIYKKDKYKDNFLYIELIKENTFG